MLSFKRTVSLMMALCIVLSLCNGIRLPARAVSEGAANDSAPEDLQDTTATSGMDENGFIWTSDGNSVTITGYDPAAGSLFYGLEYQGHYYGLSQNQLSWEEARVSCEDAGGKLVSINTADEQTFIERLLDHASSGNHWIGAYKTAGVWQWVDGEVLGYTNWDPGEPNGNADTAHIYYSNHRWDDASGTMYYICEWTEEPAEDYFRMCKLDLVIPEKINDLPVTTIGNSAFANKKTISSVVIPGTVATIDASAFSGCTELKAVTFADGLTTIGFHAFDGCSALLKADLPDAVTTINPYAFANCTSLSSFTYPANWSSVPAVLSGGYKYGNIFSGCSSLTSITVPEGVTKVPDYAFHNSAKLQEVNLPSTLTTIGSYAFYNCTEITEMQLPETLVTIDSYAFQNCTGLPAIEFPMGLKTIGFHAFDGCSALLKADLPDTVTTINPYAFANCTSLRSFTYPANWSSVPAVLSGGYKYGNIFSGCSSLTSVTVPEGVTKVPDYAFYNCTKLQEVNLPSTLTTIGSYAFYNCTEISEMQLPETLVTIDSYAFQKCTGLPAIEFPMGLKTIGFHAFDGCSAILEADLPDTVTTIYPYAFANCTSLSSFTYPANWSSVPAVLSGGYKYGNIFSGCSSLTSITVPEGVTKVPDYAFHNSAKLQEVNLPSTLTTIGSYAFYNCTEITEMQLPETLVTIDSYAFQNCTGLPAIGFPMGLKTIGFHAFDGCSALLKADLPDTVTTINPYAFANCTSLRSFTYPANWSSVPAVLSGGYKYGNIFSGCSSLTSVTVPEGVTKVPDYAFYSCADLQEVNLPSTLTTIGSYAFYNCTGISEIDLAENIVTIGSYAFNGCAALTQLNIAAGATLTGYKIEAEKTNIISGNPNWGSSSASGGYCVDYAYDLDFEVHVSVAGKFQLVEYACFNHRTFKLYVDNELVGVISPMGSDSSTITKYDCAELYLAEGTHKIKIKQNSGYTPIFDYFVLRPEAGAVGEILGGEAFTYYSGLTFIGENAFANTALTDVYYNGMEEQWNTISISEGNDPLKNATFHFAHTHVFGQWKIDEEPTCVHEGKKHKTCVDCEYSLYEAIEKVAHTYELEVVPPTYIEQGYHLYTCVVCGDSYKDTYVDSLDRTELSSATLELEYTSTFYEGVALMPHVTLTYEGVTFDSAKELKITYSNNDQVGTATVTIEGINRFAGTVELQFEIAYEVIPEQIVNVIANGEIGKISITWGESSEVMTDRYNVYRKAEGETEYRLIKTVNDRNVLYYEDKDVEKGKTYSYYVTGVGLYGAESKPSMVVSATVQYDQVAPVVLKITPAATSVVSGKTMLSIIATDNIAVTKAAYFYSVDNGETWLLIGETTNKALNIMFDTYALEGTTVKVKAVAYDAEGNASEPMIVVYSLDNTGPEKVTGLSAVVLPSKITLSWNDVTANDAASFILQTYSNNMWTTVASKITTLGYTVAGLHPATDYLYRVACVDTHGNIGEFSDVFTAKTAVDVTAPVITAQSPNAARYNSTIKFSATAKDDCDIRSMEIQVSTDRSSWTTVSTNVYVSGMAQQTYSDTIDLSAYAEGSLFVRAIAKDFSGNVSDTSDSAPYTEYIIDRTGPKAPKNVAANGNDGYITVSWSMGTAIDLGKYFVYKSTSLDGDYQLIASDLSSLNYHDRDVQNGSEFYYKVRVSDTCGNMSQYSSAVSATMAPDTQTPEITSISTTYQQKVSPTSHTINVAATDNNKLSYMVVECCTSVDGQYVQLVKAENIDNHYKSISVTLPIEDLTDGDVIYLRAYAVDMAGQRSEAATAEYTLDTTAPQIRDYQAVHDHSTVTLSWNDCGDSDLAGFKIYRSTNGGSFALLGSRAVNSNGSYRFLDTIAVNESAVYDYKLEAVDCLGNTAFWVRSVNYTYVYVNQKPTACLDIPNFMTVGVEEVLDASGSSDDIAIMSYLWDFGDGTTSTQVKPVKSYAAVGTYQVTLTVTDNEGVASTATGSIEVKEREQIGTVNVKVVDKNGKALTYVPVYFDLGSENQKVVRTNGYGVATMQLPNGTHTIGMYTAGYLPVKKDVVVLANAIRTVTLTTVEEDLVTGNFEVTRMTFDEIVAAGIDIYDPANQNVYSATVRVTYGTMPMTITYVRNDEKIITYAVKDSNGNPVTYYTNSNGEARKITNVIHIRSDIVAIIDIPASVSYLKEFFDVKLHIINNASSDFTLEKNEVVLNVPEGMTLMSDVGSGYETKNTVQIDSIKGRETVTLSWVLRGDKAGEYDLSADFSGTLAEFDELVTARFETEEPIKVYGMDGIKFRILAADRIYNDTLYFNVELENERDVDIHVPAIGITDKVENVTESVLYGNEEGDFFAEVYLLNAYVQTGSGKKQYLPITYDANGRITTAIESLSPGQKIVYEYVAYNAINYDGVAYFKDAAIQEFEGMLKNIETGSFHRTLYSFKDYSKKLDAILSGTDDAVADAYEYLSNDANYYYVDEANDVSDTALKNLYKLCDGVINADVRVITQDEEKDLIDDALMALFADESMVKMTEDYLMSKYEKGITSLINEITIGRVDSYINQGFTAGQVAKLCADLTKKSKELTIIYREKGEEAFSQELSRMSLESGVAITIDVAATLAAGEDIAIFAEAWKIEKAFLLAAINAEQEIRKDAWFYALLKHQCNVEVAEMVLDAILEKTHASLLKEYQYALASGWIHAGADVMSLRDAGLGEEALIWKTAYSMKKMVENADKKFYGALQHIIEEGSKEAISFQISTLMKKTIGSSPMMLISAAFSIIDVTFGWGNYVKQQDAMEIYKSFADVFTEVFQDSIATRNSDADFCSMTYLRAICEMRLSGEAKYKEFINNYANGTYFTPVSEAEIVTHINNVRGTSYTTIDEWWDDVQYSIVSSRDVLFNIEQAADPIVPAAPAVRLDYDKLQTVQSFGPEYEYCFADGIWKACVDAPIDFEVGAVAGTLRVRKAATDKTLAGEITTVKIYAKKDLSKLITVRFDGVNYLIDHLSEQYDYQIVFAASEEAEIDWSKANTIHGSDDVVTVSGIGASPYVFIRSCHNDSLEETASDPLLCAVSIKQKLNLTISGSGTVAQTDRTGYYFVGDTAELTATTVAGSEFLGWNVNGTCVSTDEYYLVEMAEGLEVTAMFTGSHICDLSISKMPQKVQYLVGEYVDVSGMEVTVTFTDGTTMITDHYTAQLTSNVAGASQIAVSFGGKTVCYDIMICSEADSEEKPVVIPTLTLKAPTLEFKDMIKIIAFFAAENIEDVVQMGMVTYKEKTEVVDINTADYVIPGALYAEGTGRYYASSQGIHAKYLGDEVYLAIYAKLSDGSYVYTRLVSYSPITYATNQLKNSSDMNLKQLVAAMLNYGAAAQSYFGYKTDALANSSMTADQIALPESYRADMVASVPVVEAAKQGAFVNNGGFSARRPAVSFEGAFSINYLFTPAYMPMDDITLYYWTEAEFNAADVLTADHATGTIVMEGEGMGQYSGIIEGIAAKDLSDVIYVAVIYSDGTTTWTSGVLGYSVKVYCGSLATKGGTIADLAMATAVYGHHAKQYFGS